MKTLKDILGDLNELDACLKSLRDKLFWHDYKEAAKFGQKAYQETGHIAASLELLADKQEDYIIKSKGV